LLEKEDDDCRMNINTLDRVERILLLDGLYRTYKENDNLLFYVNTCDLPN